MWKRWLSKMLLLLVLSFATFGIAIACPPQQTNSFQFLQTALATPDWQEGDRLTRDLISDEIAASPYYYDNHELDRLSCQTIQHINDLWQAASDGQFGWRSQLAIWQQEQVPGDLRKTVENFRDRVGWQRSEPLTEEQAFSLQFDRDWRSQLDLNYSLEAPVGHLPWAGISQDFINDLLSQDGPSCGSCTIDAFHLQSERFYYYLPPLFARLEDCLGSGQL
ncbi:MAG: GUN4 domain-containing protein [Jaaginema sp. PMC 1079.18]|nr:GUN4 domain-containing protein [Jaaginema sp. PMC 1080.18]MEC4853692.1 GUN4 domain-containing protein [Jaaginema sp. PMC 1079.18]MEC4867787.1 GUN4 domain-containing protein [Jaaginema sp. PMC 1078.18]